MFFFKFRNSQLESNKVAFADLDERGYFDSDQLHGDNPSGHPDHLILVWHLDPRGLPGSPHHGR